VNGGAMNSIQLPQRLKLLALAMMHSIIAGCTISAKVSEPVGVEIPYMKNSANECYYLDDFMPLPDRLVTGKHGTLGLRYYSYNSANYKDFDPRQKIILSFYSHDSRCWSLFEEYLLTD
jgi:hypothetical protein